MTNMERSAGVLLHVSSLPNKYGIGSLGKGAIEFIDFLAKNNFSFWQTLPICPNGDGYSPYQSQSTNAYNHLFIDIDELIEKGLLFDSETENLQKVSLDNTVNYEQVEIEKKKLLRLAYSRFNREDEKFIKFKKDKKIKEYAIFKAMKKLDQRVFTAWGTLTKKELLEFEEKYSSEIDYFIFLCYEFTLEWQKIKKYANKKGISLIGDVPIYVAYDSADVCFNTDIFALDHNREMVSVAGVPPDYFSSTGQLWGNPLYNWKCDGVYKWWTDRVKRAFSMFDYVRVDHFRAFADYYSIKNGSENAIFGEWIEGPNMKLFNYLKEKKVSQNFIAEDLGTIDDRVRNLLRETGFPGMKVAIFGYDGNPYNEHLPCNYPENSVAYTGTHDNNTLCGFLSTISENAKEIVERLTRHSLAVQNIEGDFSSDKELALKIIECVLSSRSNLAIIPMQDILLLGEEARMNTPSTVGGNNWRFRIKSSDYENENISLIKSMIQKYNR